MVHPWTCCIWTTFLLDGFCDICFYDQRGGRDVQCCFVGGYHSVSYQLPVSSHDTLAVPYRVFFVDTLNFSFWTSEGDASHGYSVQFKDKEYTGYWSLCVAVNRALEV